MSTRSSFSCSHTRWPPRPLSCRAFSCRLSSRRLQNGMSCECAEPVTGSSSMPSPGAKKRETKSVSPLPLAVMMSLSQIFFQRPELRARSRAQPLRLRAAARDRGSGALRGSSLRPVLPRCRRVLPRLRSPARKIQRDPVARALHTQRTALRMKHQRLARIAEFVEHPQAEARVACPQRLISAAGVNQRM